MRSVLVRDFQLQILDGATGGLKKFTWMPKMAPDLKERPYELNSGDSIAFLNLSGAREPSRNPRQGPVQVLLGVFQ